MNKNYEDHIEVTKGRMFEDSVYRLDSGKLKKELGWHPTVGLREGLFRMYEWINSNSDRLSMAQGDFELRA